MYARIEHLQPTEDQNEPDEYGQGEEKLPLVRERVQQAQASTAETVASDMPRPARVPVQPSSVDSGGGSPSPSRILMTHEVASAAVPKKLHFRTPINRLSTRRYEAVGSSSGSVVKPDCDDCLRRTAVVVHRHVATCEAREARSVRRKQVPDESSIFHAEASRVFHEANYATPRHRVTTYRLPLAWMGFQFSMSRFVEQYTTPSMEDVYHFLSTLFVRAHLSSECSVVCLIYVERLMDKGKVSLLSATWRPILLCSMLLASKVWQDCASWYVALLGLVALLTLLFLRKEYRVFCRLP